MSGAGGSLSVSLHICGITEDGKLWHANRPMLSDGPVSQWKQWEEVKAKGQNAPGPFVSVDSVSTWRVTDKLEELHVLGITKDGMLWYTSRVERQDWQPFKNLSTQIGGDWGKFLQVGVTEISGQLDAFVIVLTKQGEQRILHTSRQRDGVAWNKFEDLNQPQLAGFPGSFIAVDCAHLFVELLEVLQVCGITQDGKLWHTLRSASAVTKLQWLPFANVQRLSPIAPATFANVSLAQGQGPLDVCAQSGGNLWHISRFSGNPPKWQSAFDNINKLAAGKPGPFGSTSCGDVNGTLHACGVTQDGKIWHTSRTSNPTAWQAFEDVTAIIGSPGHFTFVCVTNSTLPPNFGGQVTVCEEIQMCLGNDRLQMQGASGSDRAVLQADINSLEDQGRQNHCF